MTSDAVRHAQTQWGFAKSELASAEGKLTALRGDMERLQVMIDHQETFVAAAVRQEAEAKEFLARVMASNSEVARQEQERIQRAAALEAAQQQAYDTEQAFARVKAEREAAREALAVAAARAAVVEEGDRG
jgi:SMC interacting uncharacterized protein involved in chromosome segregation